jgi:LDH2 family malate/lactate/ureidoglycolate dehydrogenase
MPVDEFKARLAALRREIREAPRAPGIDRIYVPGELEHDHERDALESGLALDGLTWSALVEAGEEVGLSEELEAVRLPA